MAETTETLSRSRTDWQQAFLEALSEFPNITAACAKADVGRATVYRRFHEDSDFATEFLVAKQMGVEAMKDKAWDRGANGWEEPVYGKDGLLGYRTVFDHRLFMFLLKAHDPIFRDRIEVEQKGEAQAINGEILEAAQACLPILLTDDAGRQLLERLLLADPSFRTGMEAMAAGSKEEGSRGPESGHLPP